MKKVRLRTICIPVRLEGFSTAAISLYLIVTSAQIFPILSLSPMSKKSSPYQICSSSPCSTRTRGQPVSLKTNVGLDAPKSFPYLKWQKIKIKIKTKNIFKNYVNYNNSFTFFVVIFNAHVSLQFINIRGICIGVKSN